MTKSDLTIMGAHVATQLQHVKLWHMTYIIKILTSIIIYSLYLYLHYAYLYSHLCINILGISYI